MMGERAGPSGKGKGRVGSLVSATPRMSDVAKLASVSTMTVSRVLNKSSNVTEAVRQRVHSAIEQLRYRPNQLARSLRGQRSRQIGIIVPYLYDPFFAICAHAISTVAQQHSYSVVLSTSNEEPEAEFEEASRMLSRNIEGLILIPAHSMDASSLLLAGEFERMPIVTLDRPIEGSSFASILVENERGARMGTEHLLALGHERIAYIGLPNELYTMKMRHAGYLAAMQDAGYRPQVTIVSRSIEDAMAKIEDLLSRRNAPTALFCANNMITRHVLHSLKLAGIYPPESIALVGFDDFATADLLRPGITVVRQPDELLGRTAAEFLFTYLADKPGSEPGVHTILPVELVVRGSCGAAPLSNGVAHASSST